MLVSTSKTLIRSTVIHTRCIHSTHPPRKDLLSILSEATAEAESAAKHQPKSNSSPPKTKTPTIPKTRKTKTLPADYLNNKYRSKFKVAPSVGALAEVNGFFHQTQVKLEWTTANFLDIPGERQRVEEEKLLSKHTEEELEHIDTPLAKKGPTPRTVGLPEVVFLGKCNVGKSSLLNGLLTDSKQKDALEFAYASKRAGYTQTMNCFNIGNRFKLVDTPGYGVKGKPEQGKQVMEYLHRRKELRRVYMLIGSKEGFSQDDFTIIDILIESGVPFEIVFTKVDQLIKVSTVEKHLKDSGVLDLPSEPSVTFTSSETSRKSPKRQGFGELRSSIFEACGLSPGVKPLKLTKTMK